MSHQYDIVPIRHEFSVVEKPLRQTSLPHRESLNQRLLLSSRYDMHDLLSAGFIPLDRQTSVGADDTALDELPRGFHAVHTSIEYKCSSPLYHHKGSPRRSCLKTGRWSGRHVSCSPGKSGSSLDQTNETWVTFKVGKWHLYLFHNTSLCPKVLIWILARKWIRKFSQISPFLTKLPEKK